MHSMIIMLQHCPAMIAGRQKCGIAVSQRLAFAAKTTEFGGQYPRYSTCEFLCVLVEFFSSRLNLYIGVCVKHYTKHYTMISATTSVTNNVKMARAQHSVVAKEMLTCTTLVCGHAFD